MFANTGTVSFVLYGVFILVTVVAMLFAFHFIKQDSIEAAKLDKMIELFKYAIVSTALATVTLVVTDLFKEREQDIKELEYFDKYVQDVKKVDGVQERLLLAKYLSIVAPNGEMKKSWRIYCDSVEIEYKEYKKLKQEQLKVDSIENPSNKQIFKSEQLQEKLNLYEKPLAVASAAPAKDREEWFIISGGDVTLAAADVERQKAAQLNPASLIVKKGNLYRTVLSEYFSRTDAENALPDVKSALNPSAYIVRRSSWCSELVPAEGCLLCK